MQSKFRNIIFVNMKTSSYLILLLCALLSLFACGHKPYPATLIAADSLASVNPDSAITLLYSLKEQMKSAPQATQMYYRLLCIKANDKAYIMHTSDSLILPILHYYIEENDEQHLTEAYYYAGRVYRDLEDGPQALHYLEKALEVLPKDDKYPLKSHIYSQMGTLFLYQGLYNQALEIFKKRYVCNTDLKDSVGLVYTLRDMAGAYRNINREDSSIYYYQIAFKIGEKLQRPDLTNMIQSQIASLYIHLGKYDLAKIALQDALIDIEHPNKSGIYSIAAEFYRNIGMTDSAAYYYKALLDFGTIYAKETAHRSLAEFASKEGNHKLAIQHFQAGNLCTDSIQKITYTESLNRMYSLYNYQLREKENNRLKDENQKKTNYIIYSLIGFSAIIAFFFVYSQHNEHKKQELKRQLQRAEQIKEINYKRSQQFIEENNLQIQKLEEELNNVNSTNNILRKEIQNQKELLHQETRRAEIEQIKREQSQEVLSNSGIYLLLKERLLDPQGRIFITAEEWLSIENTLKEIYPDFFEKLNDIYTFNDSQLHVCMLIKAGFSPSEIAKLMKCSKETITSIRRRLYNRIFQEKGKPEDWDNFITSL